MIAKPRIPSRARILRKPATFTVIAQQILPPRNRYLVRDSPHRIRHECQRDKPIDFERLGGTGTRARTYLNRVSGTLYRLAGGPHLHPLNLTRRLTKTEYDQRTDEGCPTSRAVREDSRPAVDTLCFALPAGPSDREAKGEA